MTANPNAQPPAIEKTKDGDERRVLRPKCSRCNGIGLRTIPSSGERITCLSCLGTGRFFPWHSNK